PTDAFSLSSSSVTFNATQGGVAPPPQVVNVTVNSGAVFFSTSSTGTAFFQSFALTGATTGQITITPGSTFAAGTFTGAITVNGCSNAFGPCNHVAGSPKTINVTYNVAGLSSMPAQLDFSATTGSNPPSKTSTLAIAGGSASWVSSISYSPSGINWLSVNPASGALTPSAASQTLTFTANTAGLAAGVYNATATFSSGGSLTASVTVTLSIGDPGVNFVAPYVVGSGVSGTVIIRGRGFAALNPSTLSVQVNSTPVTASIVSDTEIHATYPALAAGTYSISVGDGGAPL